MRKGNVVVVRRGGFEVRHCVSPFSRWVRARLRDAPIHCVLSGLLTITLLGAVCLVAFDGMIIASYAVNVNMANCTKF